MSTVLRKVHFKFENRSKRLKPGPAPEHAVEGVVRRSRRRQTAGGVPRIAKLMALAIRFDEMLAKGEVRSQSDLAKLCHVTQPRMTQIMNLLHLAPDIQEQILAMDAVLAEQHRICERAMRPLCLQGDWETQHRGWEALRR